MNNKYIKHLIKLLSLATIMGVVYYFIEILWRGWSSWEMVVVGGICAATIGLIDEKPHLKRMSLWKQNLLATVIVLGIELIAGIYLNIHLQKAIWDYSDLPLNILGQISLLYGVFWYLLCPFGFWLDNWLRYKLFGREKPCGLLHMYITLFRKG